MLRLRLRRTFTGSARAGKAEDNRKHDEAVEEAEDDDEQKDLEEGREDVGPEGKNKFSKLFPAKLVSPKSPRLIMT